MLFFQSSQSNVSPTNDKRGGWRLAKSGYQCVNRLISRSYLLGATVDRIFITPFSVLGIQRLNVRGFGVPWSKRRQGDLMAVGSIRKLLIGPQSEWALIRATAIPVLPSQLECNRQVTSRRALLSLW